MQEHVGIVRDRRGAREGHRARSTRSEEKAENVKAHGASQYNPGWHEALSIHSLLLTSEAVARAAHMREESRGAHTRLDHEGESEEWLKYNIIISKAGDGSMKVEKRRAARAAAAA